MFWPNGESTEKPIDAELTAIPAFHRVRQGVKKSGLVGTLPAENSGTFLADPKKLTSTASGGWWWW